MQLADKAVRKGVRRFIYASSGSVYGVKEEAQVTEDLELRPISEYNKTKMVAERVLLSYANELVVQIIRPATVCGYSPRMRLDVSVNLLTMQALTKEHITVFGGDQVRPNIHIDDITDVYPLMLRMIEHEEIHVCDIVYMDIGPDLVASEHGDVFFGECLHRQQVHRNVEAHSGRVSAYRSRADDLYRQFVRIAQ